MTQDQDRQRTTEALGEVGTQIYDVADAISPRLATYVTSSASGSALPDDVDLRRRSAMRIAALACKGESGELFDNEISAALENGVSPPELVEVMIHTIPYVGIPRPLNSILACKGTFDRRSLLPVELEEPTWSESERMSIGLQRINEAHPLATPVLEENLRPIAASLYRFIVAAAFGDVYGRPGLSYPQRQPITIVALTVQGGVPNHVRTHINGALNIGMIPITIAEAVVDTIGIADSTHVLEALRIAADVFPDRKADPNSERQTW